MKKIFSIAAIVIAAITVSCSSNDSSSSSNDELFLRFKVNGIQKNYVNDDIISTESLAFNISNNPNETDNFTTVILNMPVEPTMGNHNIVDSGDLETTYQASYNTADVNVDGVGTMAITHIDADYVEGTFSFSGTDSTTGAPYAITEGKFRAYNITN